MTTPWTPETMLERIGGDEELARQLVSLFLGDYERMLGDLRTSVASGGADPVRRAAHALKGSVANFVDDGPVATALAMEMLGKEGRLEDAPALLAQLEGEIDALVSSMREFEAGAACEY